MVLAIRIAQLLINKFNYLKTNKPVQMEAVNDVIRPFEGNINPGYPTGIKVDIQPTK